MARKYKLPMSTAKDVRYRVGTNGGKLISLEAIHGYNFTENLK